MKRSLGPRYWIPSQNEGPAPKPRAQGSGLPPLTEGPVFGTGDSSVKCPRTVSRAPGTPKAIVAERQYARGSIRTAMVLAANEPELSCSILKDKVRSDTSIGPQESRTKTWAELCKAAGFDNPFCLTPAHIFTVMGVLDRANYRSAELFLDAAKQTHIELGFTWS